MKQAAETAEQLVRRPNNSETSLTPRERTNLSSSLGTPQAKLYAADVTAILNRSLELANWSPLDTERLLPRRIAIWTEFLYPRVPQDRLREAFDAALDAHSGSFPVTATEINQAWRAIREREALDAAQKARAEAHLAPKPCEMAHNNEEEKLVAILDQATGQDVLMPCPNCRPRAFAQKQAEALERRRVAAVEAPAEEETACATDENPVTLTLISS